MDEAAGIQEGSPESQVARWTKRINELATHFRTHPKDRHSRQGLLRLVSRRRRMLDYLKRKDKDRYGAVLKKEGLRR